MWRANPVFAGVRNGLLALSAGDAQRTYFGCLIVQAVALALWWPRSALVDSLAAEHRPEPLMATVIAIGVTTAYYSLRTGAEEFLLPGQQSLREWVLSTPLSIERILFGSVFAHLWQTLFLLLLSSPLICVAFAISGGEWSALAHNLGAVIAQAMFFWLAGAVIYLRIGHYGQTTYIAARALLVGVYFLTTLFFPAASHLMLSIDALGDDNHSIDFGIPMPAYQLFLWIYGGMIAVLLVLFRAELRRYRKSADSH